MSYSSSEGEDMTSELPRQAPSTHTMAGVDVSSSQQVLAGYLVQGDAGGISQINSLTLNSIQHSQNNPQNNPPSYHSSICGHGRCETCVDFVCASTFSSSVTGRVYNVVNDIENVCCNTVNVIYLLTCKLCSMQYVGETVQKFNTRMAQHRRSTPMDSGTYGCKVLSEHFKGFPCCGFGFSCQIIQKLPGDGRDLSGTIDSTETVARRKIEDDWMCKLRTVWPYGLNDKCRGKLWTNMDDDVFVARELFPKLPSKSQFRKRGHQASGNDVSADALLQNINNICNCNLDIPCVKCVLNYTRCKIQTIPKSTGKKLSLLVHELIHQNQEQNKLPLQYYTAILDMLNSKFSPANKKSIKKQKKKPAVLCKIFFQDKHVQDLGVSRIFRDKNIINSLPPNVNIKQPVVVYSFTSPIRNKIFNYSQEVKNFDMDDFLANINSSNCECSNSPFLDKDHGHIVTGNLDIIKDSKLRFLFEQGPNFREQPSNTNFGYLEKNIKKSISNCIEKWAIKEGLPIEAFNEWKSKVFNNLSENIKNVKKHRRKTNDEILKDNDALQELGDLKNKYILVPVDKASQNISFICKRFYFTVLLKEVGLWPGNNSNTYKLINNTEENIAKKQIESIQKNIKNLDISNVSNNLPFMYWVPKFHKVPTKFRFIVSSRNCPVKPLSKAITKCLKLVFNQNVKYCNAIRKFTGINRMWVTENFIETAKDIEKVNDKQNAKSIETYDFSSLYTTLDLNNLKENLTWCIEKAFNGLKQKYIAIYKTGANWVNKPRENTLAWEKTVLIGSVNWLIFNSYFVIGNKVFLQIIGLGMGLDPAPFMANLHLYKYEFEFMDRLTKNQYSVARKLNYTKRFIDDLETLNSNNLIQEMSAEIYPPELILNKENSTNKKATFLQMKIEIEDSMFVTSVYDKRDDFPFKIVQYPSILSNIPDKTLDTVFISQVVSYIRVCNRYSPFKERVEILASKIISKGAKSFHIKIALKKVLQKYSNEIARWDLSADNVFKAISIH